jgi:hypothetical protein
LTLGADRVLIAQKLSSRYLQEHSETVTALCFVASEDLSMPISKGLLVVASGMALLWPVILPAWSDGLPPVPSPKGFVEASSLVPALKDQALLGHPSRTKIIGVYLLPDELAKIMNGAPSI